MCLKRAEFIKRDKVVYSCFLALDIYYIKQNVTIKGFRVCLQFRNFHIVMHKKLYENITLSVIISAIVVQ